MSAEKKNTASLKTLKIALCVCIIAALALVLGFLDSRFVCYDGSTYKSDITELDLRGAQSVDINRLCRFRSLETLDLRDSALTVEQAETLRRKMPGCDLLWTITIAGEQYDSDTEKLELKSPTEADFELLPLFDRLTEVSITGCELYELMMELDKSMTGCKLIWTVPVCGKEYKSTVSALTLPEAAPEDIERLQYLPQLLSVDFTGCTEYESIMSFARQRPGCDVTWTVDFFGTAVSSAETEIDISGTKISDAAELERMLGFLPRLEKLVVCDCGLSNTALDELNRKYENVKIVWRVYFGVWSLRTDATVFSTQNYDPPAYALSDKEASVLRYCTVLQMLDLGHNGLTTVEPFTELTNLKVLILADNRISDISTLNKLTKLEYFEMFINRISDISVVQYMPNLTDVNFCWNRISDPSPLYDHEHLERVWMCGNRMSSATRREFMKALPDTEFDLYSTYGSTNGNWRNNDHFDKIRDGFRNHNGLSDYHW